MSGDADQRQVAADYDLIYADWDKAVATVQGFMTGHLPIDTGTLLDAHCGTGLASDAATRLGWVVTAAEASPAMLERTRNRLPDVETRVAPPLSLHTSISRRFDAVISVGNALPALRPDQVRQALAEMRKCTRPGGAAMIAVRDFGDRLKSAVWRDDPVVKITARFRYQSASEIIYTLDVEDAEGERSHDQVLHPLSSLALESGLEDAGYSVTRTSRIAGRVVIAALAV
jgi:SAM-dependent methyltransferase